MKQKNKKLDIFLSFALMDQQLGLVIYESKDQVEQVKATLKERGDEYFEVESLNEFNQLKKGYGLFNITKSNINTVLESIETVPFPGFLKVVFVVEMEMFETLEDTEQEKILSIFNPIFRP